MAEDDGVAEAIAAARIAVAADVANVAAAIDAALADIDEQLAGLHERRLRLEAASGAVNDQITAVDAHRAALAAARAQAPVDGDGTAGAGSAPSDDGASYDEVESFLEFSEEELDPALARTDRIVTILDRASYEMKAADIADILNQFGDDTTSKVVSGTLSNLVRRGMVSRAGAGAYSVA
ncbi:MAG TPA: hypothetical protein VM287_01010 [Egibacteraceae bacterium]|nr:hypothetical protein [Egibacteraceae bacterium]